MSGRLGACFSHTRFGCDMRPLLKIILFPVDCPAEIYIKSRLDVLSLDFQEFSPFFLNVIFFISNLCEGEKIHLKKLRPPDWPLL